MKHLWTMQESDNWREIQRELTAVIKLTNKPHPEICRRSGISSSHYYRLLQNPERMQPKHFVAIFRTILEMDNFERVKKQSDG